MKAQTITNEQLKDARKAGFRRKKPRKPRASASKATFENFIKRWNEYCTEAKRKAAEYRQREKLKDQVRKIG